MIPSRSRAWRRCLHQMGNCPSSHTELREQHELANNLVLSGSQSYHYTTSQMTTVNWEYGSGRLNETNESRVEHEKIPVCDQDLKLDRKNGHLHASFLLLVS